MTEITREIAEKALAHPQMGKLIDEAATEVAEQSGEEESEIVARAVAETMEQISGARSKTSPAVSGDVSVDEFRAKIAEVCKGYGELLDAVEHSRETFVRLRDTADARVQDMDAALVSLRDPTVGMLDEATLARVSDASIQRHIDEGGEGARKFVRTLAGDDDGDTLAGTLAKVSDRVRQGQNLTQMLLDSKGPIADTNIATGLILTAMLAKGICAIICHDATKDENGE